jgi:hypothetical protein
MKCGWCLDRVLAGNEQGPNTRCALEEDEAERVQTQKIEYAPKNIRSYGEFYPRLRTKLDQSQLSVEIAPHEREWRGLASDRKRKPNRCRTKHEEKLSDLEREQKEK